MKLAFRILKWGLVGIGLISVFLVGSFMMMVIAMNADGVDEE